MRHCTALALFESSGDHAVVQDPVNEQWVAFVTVLDGEQFEALARRYYLALHHFRKQKLRPALPGNTEFDAQSRQQAFEAVLGGEHPQLLARDNARYQQRTGVERAIKRLKVELRGEHLTHRDGLRVQAHLDRKLLTLHLLLAVAASP